MKVPRLVRLRTDEGCHTALVCKVGNVWAQMVWIESGGIGAHMIPIGDLSKHGKDLESTSVRKAARTMLKAGKLLGITKTAKRLLKGCV